MYEPHDRLRQARADAGYSNARDAVEAYGWTYSTYLGHENGSRGITANAAARYARAFRVTKSWLLFGETQSATKSSAATPPQTLAATGFAEPEATPFVGKSKQNLIDVTQLANTLTRRAKRPYLYELSKPVPDCQLLSGDILCCDLQPNSADDGIVVINAVNEGTGDATTLVRRTTGGHIIPSITNPNEFNGLSLSTMAVVVGSLRGLTDA